jgi:VIT1/CCC1 family predicted Fe2+/Mn2+ transporter
MTYAAATGSGAPDRERLEWAGLLPSRRLLDPDERVSEILFGLIMVVSITGTVSVATGGQEGVGTMLQAAIGCNLAWGIADGVMYLLSTLIQRGRAILALRAVRSVTDGEVARSVLSRLLPPRVVAVLTAAELDAIRRRLADGAEPPARPALTVHDYLAAVAVCALVFLSTFPVVIPFLLTDDARRALGWSQAIALAMLFLLGWFTGKHVGGRPLRVGFLMVLLGVALVAIVNALGG